MAFEPFLGWTTRVCSSVHRATPLVLKWSRPAISVTRFTRKHVYWDVATRSTPCVCIGGGLTAVVVLCVDPRCSAPSYTTTLPPRRYPKCTCNWSANNKTRSKNMRRSFNSCNTSKTRTECKYKSSRCFCFCHRMNWLRGSRDWNPLCKDASLISILTQPPAKIASVSAAYNQLHE